MRKYYAFVLSMLSVVVGKAAFANEPLKYNRDIRPILAENCFACHGADSASRKAKLRLDEREVAIERGAIVPKNLDESELAHRLYLADDDEQRMPPPSSHKQLSNEQKETLKRWISEGAVYEPHWSFIAPRRPVLPTVKNADWARQPIDRFILAELEKVGLQPAPEVDRRTLARRASLDVTGLLPDPKLVEQFVNDTSPNAYERYLDELFRSPHWGEHRARYWLDAARYADTHGIHFDNFREVYSYRDWVIQAFNTNQPFDQFTREQLAGDLLPNPTLDQLIATGFNRNNITTNEGGAINEEYLVLYTRDRTETASTVFMGLTTGCAVCHDHKFDPVSQKEFYELAAFFNNTTQNAMDGNIKDTPPVIFVPAREDRDAWAKLEADLRKARQAIDDRKASVRPEFEAWLNQQSPESARAEAPQDGLYLHASLDHGRGKRVLYTAKGATKLLELPQGAVWKPSPYGAKVLNFSPNPAEKTSLTFPEGIADFEHNQAFSYGAWVQIPQRGQNAGIVAKMDQNNAFRGFDLWLENDKFAAHIIDSWPQAAFKITTKNSFNPNDWHHVFATYDGTGLAGFKLYVNGELQTTTLFDGERNINDPKEFKGKLNTIRNNVPLAVGQRSHGQNVRTIAIQDLRVYDRNLTETEVKQIVVSTQLEGYLTTEIANRKPENTNQLFEWWISAKDVQVHELTTAYQRLKSEELDFKSRGTIAHISVEKPSPPEAYILNRGEYDQRLDKVGPSTPKALSPWPNDAPRNRLGFAQWLLSPEHPLTARVTVNRFWGELFGTGLVRTAGDFGISGELPSHPELLDYLAVEFRETGWDVKAFFKQVLMTNTYRQAAVHTQEKLQKDPLNRLLSRGPRFRMDAEMIRDNALAASGLLVPKIGGPSVKPYQPEGVWEAVAMIGSNTRNYKQDQGENLYRRSMYTFWKRSAPPASMEILNAPNRETCTVQRDRTNTPLQALVTLNDVQFIEAARKLAEAACKTEQEMKQRIDYIAQRVLSRSFTPQEQAIIEKTLAQLQAEFAATPAEAKRLIQVGESAVAADLRAEELAAWTMLANQLMNLDEFLCK